MSVHERLLSQLSEEVVRLKERVRQLEREIVRVEKQHDLQEIQALKHPGYSYEYREE